MADAAYQILLKPSRELTGKFLIDEDVLREAGVTDLSRYNPPGIVDAELMRDFFV
jgi:citronellol/citronellal dehydrogenase